MDRVAQMQPNKLARFIEVEMVAELKARAEYKNRTAHLSAALRLQTLPYRKSGARCVAARSTGEVFLLVRITL